MAPSRTPWTGTRKYELPHGWKALRRKVAERAAGRCEKIRPDGQRCPNEGNECHHVGDPHDHSMSNLAWLCHDCHFIETSKQAMAARQRVADKLSHPSKRSTAKPPGLL